VRQIADTEADNPRNRMNDGKCDRAGRFWAGTMPYEWQARPGEGALYRLNPDHSVEKVVAGITLSNGLDWSPDDTRMYYVDSPTRRLDVFDFDAASGAISNRRTLAEIEGEGVVPDKEASYHNHTQ
jgi:sugar lactone lactonase YvrE